MTIDPAFDPLKERLQRAVAPDYRVEHRIGEGGMGVVYRAHEVLMNRAVAIKVLRPELATADASETFLREAPMMGNVRHKNVVVILRSGRRPWPPVLRHGVGQRTHARASPRIGTDPT